MNLILSTKQMPATAHYCSSMLLTSLTFSTSYERLKRLPRPDYHVLQPSLIWGLSNVCYFASVWTTALEPGFTSEGRAFTIDIVQLSPALFHTTVLLLIAISDECYRHTNTQLRILKLVLLLSKQNLDPPNNLKHTLHCT